MYKIFFILILLLSFASISLYSTNYGKYQIQKESTLWIEGTSTVNKYKCLTAKVSGEGILDSARRAAPVIGVPYEVYIKAAFAVQVKSMDCGNGAMNEDMYDALKSDDYDKIYYELKKVEIDVESLKNSANYSAMTWGILTVAGVKREIKMKVNLSSISKNKFRIEGNKEVLMSDFGVKPPTALFGLIKANDKLTFFFDIYVTNY